MKKQYVTPSVDITEVRVEKGFATSLQPGEVDSEGYGANGCAGGLTEGQTLKW